MKHLTSIIAILITALLFALPVFAQEDATPEITPESTEEADATCFVTTDEARTVRVRVGPGENRTSVTFLPEDEEIPVLGEAEDDDENLWYQLDKELAAPGRTINEAWVAADDVETVGDCDDIDDAAAPPIIPIITQPTVSADDTAEAGESTEETTVSDGITATGGNWTLTWGSTTNVSCVGTDNVVAPTVEIFGPVGAGLLPSSSLLINITRPNAEAPFMFMFTPMYAQANGSYRGEINFVDNDGTFLPATITINPISSPTQMSGRMTVNAGECSGTVSFTARLS